MAIAAKTELMPQRRADLETDCECVVVQIGVLHGRGQAGSYIMAQKRTVGAVTSGSHFGAVTSGQSPHCQSASATRFQPLPLSGRRHSPRRHNVSVTEVCSILPCPPPPSVIRPADYALPVLKFRSKSKLQVRVEDGIYYLVPSVQAGTQDHR